MSDAQTGLFVQGPPCNLFLEYRLNSAGGDDAAVRAAVRAALDAPLAKGQTRMIGFGDGLWRRLAGGRAPEKLKPFTAIKGPKGYHAPATQEDIWIWLQAEKDDDNFDLAVAVNAALSPVADLVLEVRGFKYHGERDLIGFVDGTGNPKTEELRRDAALIPDSGGASYAFTQKWVHDLSKFNAVPVPEQEWIVGRTKVDDIELEGDDMPPDSHVSRTDLKEDGVALKIYRRSAPYGSVDEHGLYFLAFACDPRRVDAQLESMYGLTDDGLHDRIIEFSQAVTGAYWYVPGTDELKQTISG